MRAKRRVAVPKPEPVFLVVGESPCRHCLADLCSNRAGQKCNGLMERPEAPLRRRTTTPTGRPGLGLYVAPWPGVNQRSRGSFL
jgi:hypothetical protein